MIDKNKIYELYEIGAPLCDIAEHVGCSEGYVYDLIRKKYGKKPKRDAGRIRSLWAAGWSINQIMNDTHLTEEEVRRVVIHGQV